MARNQSIHLADKMCVITKQTSYKTLISDSIHRDFFKLLIHFHSVILVSLYNHDRTNRYNIFDGLFCWTSGCLKPRGHHLLDLICFILLLFTEFFSSPLAKILYYSHMNTHAHTHTRPTGSPFFCYCYSLQSHIFSLICVLAF